ncbi:MAG: cyclic nucleotide-binding domain-containing protein [Gammaproteobacteria bacterium]|nr:cyclic nucleotide-binding domain-containing protein [Gammaproteobacteria bacterium]
MSPDYAIALTAFWVGVVSAISLPLGTVTSRFWVPEERTVAGLMAFGGGALLAALSIDLVAPALDHGHFVQIAIGSVLGGLIFVLANEAVNDYGGFVRRMSTRVYHLRRQEHQRMRDVLSHLRDLDIFGEVEARDFRAVAAFVEIRQQPANTPIYREGDPCNGLYILARGRVSLLDPLRHNEVVRVVNTWETFSRLAFLTGAPHDDIAVANADSEVWFLSRDNFLHLLVSSPRLLQAVHSWLRSPETMQYLVERQHMEPEIAGPWLDSAVHDLISHGTVPPVRDIDHQEERFDALVDELGRTSLFTGLPANELDALGECLIHKHCNKGEAFFHDGELADRLYIIDRGEVSLFDARNPTRKHEVLRRGAVFGALSFAAGARHSSSAVASEDTSYWVLLRRDLPALFLEAPVLRSKFEQFSANDEVRDYLQQRHHVDPDKVDRWLNRSRAEIAAGRRPAAIDDMIREVSGHRGAALAIWLGILLDSIPESLVLGTIQARDSISLSLIAGLFISNYPEALSSSIGMKHQGLRFGRVLLMWSSLVVITGLGAALGVLFFGNVSPGNFALIEGIAAGAMLTMIAQTMLPEAYLKGGNIVGMATLFGFLTALFFRELA